jgi:hypothetical protein
MSDHFGFLWKECGDRALGRIYNLMSILHGKSAVDIQTEFDKGAVARVLRTKIMNSLRAGTGERRRLNTLAVMMTAAQREITVLDEKLQVFAPPETQSSRRAAGSR